MKLSFKILFVAVLGIMLIGCAAQKKSVATAESEILHQQALKALEDRRFIIQAEEFYYPKGDLPVKHSTGSYISMQGNQVNVVFAPGLFPLNNFLIDGRNIDDNIAEVACENKKNGDTQFDIYLQKNEYGFWNKVLITLYKNTNKCFVQINEGSGNASSASFAGYVQPIE